MKIYKYLFFLFLLTCAFFTVSYFGYYNDGDNLGALPGTIVNFWGAIFSGILALLFATGMIKNTQPSQHSKLYRIIEIVAVCAFLGLIIFGRKLFGLS